MVNAKVNEPNFEDAMIKLKNMPFNMYSLKFHDINLEKRFIKYISDSGNIYVFRLLFMFFIVRFIMLLFIISSHFIYGTSLKDLLTLLVRLLIVFFLCGSTQIAGTWVGIINHLTLYILSLLTNVLPYINGVTPDIPVFNCIAPILIRVMFSAISPNWRLSSAFFCGDFLTIFYCNYVGKYNYFSLESTAAFPCLVGLCILVLYSERMQRSNWFIQLKLDELLSLESSRRIDADKMVNFLSHEVRNPQNAIMLTAESLLIEARKDPKAFKKSHIDLFQLIYSSSEFVTSLLEDVLNFQRLSDNKITLVYDNFEIRPFLDNLSFFLQKLFPIDSQISFSTVVDPSVPKIVRADKCRIRQIITNFISNSAKFTSAYGSVLLSVSVADGNPNLINAKNIKFSVKDSGVGISETNQKLLFQKFSQIDPVNLQGSRGSGLGLNICKGLVELHGGEVGVISSLGIGSEFYFILPLGCSSDSNLTSNASSPLSNSLNYHEPYLNGYSELNSLLTAGHIDHDAFEPNDLNLDSNKKELNHASPSPLFLRRSLANIDTQKLILVVDDNLFVRMTLQRILVQLGYACDLAENGKIALNKIAKVKYQCLLIDIFMPVMDGVTTVREIRKLHDLPIIGLTGESVESETLKFLDAGANVVLIKPVKVTELSYHLNNLIKTTDVITTDCPPSTILPCIDKKDI